MHLDDCTRLVRAVAAAALYRTFLSLSLIDPRRMSHTPAASPPACPSILISDPPTAYSDYCDLCKICRFVDQMIPPNRPGVRCLYNRQMIQVLCICVWNVKIENYGIRAIEFK